MQTYTPLFYKDAKKVKYLLVSVKTIGYTQ